VPQTNIRLTALCTFRCRKFTQKVPYNAGLVPQ
jgi:hypothetical protein